MLIKFVRPDDSLDHCPECGLVGVEHDQPEFYEGGFTVRCTCTNCGYSFVDEYRYHHSYD